ncbi:MAG TPA: translocation/assembly module TamB domain-containing protein [Polyangiales bacterium]|nr:translocation/assembly module TamB domain-containing protein [Polyangiales bacterium]
MLVLAICAPLGVAAFVRTEFARELARQQASQLIREQLGLVCLIESVYIDPRTLALEARGIVLDHPDLGRFVEAKLLRIRPSWWALLRGEPDLHMITIEGASVWLTIRDGKLINGPKLAPSEGGGMSVDLPFNKLWVKQSRLIVDAGPHGGGELRDIDVTLDSTQHNVLGIQLHSPGGYVRHDERRDQVKAIEARFKLTDENVQVELARIAADNIAITLRRASVELPWKQIYHGEAELQLNLAALHTWPIPVTLPPLAGQLNVRANLVGDPEGPRGDVHIGLARGQIDQYVVGEKVSLDVAVDRKKLRWNGFSQVIRDGGRVDLSGAVELRDNFPLSLRAQVHDVSFAKLMEQLGVSPNAIVGWTLAGGFELKGTLSPLHLTGPLRMPTRDFRVTKDAWHVTPSHNIIAVAAATLNGGVLVNDNGIYLQNIDVTMRNSHLRVQEVLLGFENDVRVRATGEPLDLRDCTPLVGFPLGGKGTFEVKVDGKFQEPTVSGKVRFGDFAFGTYPFGDLESDFVMEKELEAVRFPLVTLKKHNSRYTAKDFVLDFTDKRLAINSSLHFERFAMQDFYHVFHYENDERYLPYQAIVSGDAQLHYSMDYPGDGPRGTLRADMDLSLREVEISGFAFAAGHFDGRFTWFDHQQGYRGAELDVERFALHKADTTVHISGKMAREGKLDMVAVADRISVRDTEGLAERMPQLSGSYNATGTIKGTAAQPLAEMEISTSEMRYAGVPVGDTRVYVRLTGKSDPWIQEALTWKEDEPPAGAICPHARAGLARGVWPEDPPMRTADGPQPALEAPMAYLVCGEGFDQHMTIDMAIGRTAVYPLRGQLRLKHFPLAKFLPKQRKDAGSGSLSGLLRLRGGAMLEPTTLEGDLALDVVKFGQLGVALENEGPIRAQFARGEFSLEQATLIGPSNSKVSISGGASLTGGLAFELNGNVDLSILPSFTAQLKEAKGRLTTQIKLTGMLDKPSVFGQAHIEAGKLRLSSLSFPIEGLEASATFSEQRVLFERVSAKLLGGEVQVSGLATLGGRRVESIRVELQGQRVAYAPREGVDLVMGGQGLVTWQHGDRLPKLSGTLRLDRAMYSRPITMGRTLRDFNKTERADIASYNPEADNLALDLRIVQSEPLRIQNNLIDADITIDDSKDAFRLLGTDQRFGVLGRMSIRRGTVRLRNTAFAISQGEITFDNPARVEPSFDIHGDTEVRHNTTQGSQINWQIAAHAWGTPDSFRFALTSTPYLSEDDIALLLAVGVTQTELAQFKSDMTGTAALEALATVTGVDREVQRALPAIDEVRIASAYSQRSQRTEPQLHVGKRIADRVRLDASTALSEARDFGAGVEYQISDKTSVGAAYTNQTANSPSHLGDVGVDLKWRLEFD